MDSFTLVLYFLSLVALLVSFGRDKAKTREALRKAWKALENILPQFLGVIVLVGIMLALLSPVTIGRLLGRESGWAGVFLAAIVGAVTLIPGFVAFPLAAMLLRAGAGPMQMGAFISALMMVGVVTAPVEMKYFGRRMTFFRNGLAFLYSFLVAWVIGMVVS
ncbi:MAG: permease [Firmicutes bacterium]|nr:permease [Bacillota bacterium]